MQAHVSISLHHVWLKKMYPLVCHMSALDPSSWCRRWIYRSFCYKQPCRMQDGHLHSADLRDYCKKRERHWTLTYYIVILQFSFYISTLILQFSFYIRRFLKQTNGLDWCYSNGHQHGYARCGNCHIRYHSHSRSSTSHQNGSWIAIVAIFCLIMAKETIA